jgi:hypothetical protein
MYASGKVNTHSNGAAETWTASPDGRMSPQNTEPHNKIGSIHEEQMLASTQPLKRSVCFICSACGPRAVVVSVPYCFLFVPAIRAIV